MHRPEVNAGHISPLLSSLVFFFFQLIGTQSSLIWLGWLASKPPETTSTELQVCTATPSFYMGPHVCVTTTLSTEPSPQHKLGFDTPVPMLSYVSNCSSHFVVTLGEDGTDEDRPTLGSQQLSLSSLNLAVQA